VGGPGGLVLNLAIAVGVFWWYLQKKMRSLFWLLVVPIPFGIIFLLTLENFNMELVLGDYEDEEEDVGS